MLSLAHLHISFGRDYICCKARIWNVTGLTIALEYKIDLNDFILF